MRRSIIAILGILVFVTACNHEPVKVEIVKTAIHFDSLKLNGIADTIVCDMVVKNPDAEDVWMDSCLIDFKRNDFVESVFSDIYQGKLMAIDYYSSKPLTVKEVKKLEEISGYERNIIGKFQFREAWYYDKMNHTFIKKVHSIIFGYENYDDRGFVKGYKPLFKVDF